MTTNLKTDYYKTGKLYDKLDAYRIEAKPCGKCSQCFIWKKPSKCSGLGLYYFGSSVQFKSRLSFKRFLETKHPCTKFKVFIAD